eukprot:14409719-Alexandrium_andersonii.AAC.1
MTAILARRFAFQHCNPYPEVRDPARVRARELGRVAVPEGVDKLVSRRLKRPARSRLMPAAFSKARAESSPRSPGLRRQ